MSRRPTIRRYALPPWGCLAPAGALLAALLPAGALAAPRLRCEIETGGITQVHDFTPVSDPYSVRPVDINGRFRFKAVVIGGAGTIESVALYTWYQSAGRPVILHEAKYPAPAVQAPGAAPFTGRNFIYAPGNGREFQYACTLVEVSP